VDLIVLSKPEPALVDAERAVIEAREIAQAAVLMNALTLACFLIRSAEAIRGNQPTR
jgi:hypothetical protein